MSGLVEHLERNGCEAQFRNTRLAANYIHSLGSAGTLEAVDNLNRAILQEENPERSTLRGRQMSYLDKRGEDEDCIDVSTGDVLYVPPSAVYSTDLFTEAYETVEQLPDIRAGGELAYLTTFLTHRYENGNTRTGAATKALLQTGYDGSTAVKAYLSTLGSGLEGIQQLGLDLETTFLQQQYAHMATERVLAGHGYTAGIPDSVSPTTLYDVHTLRTELPIQLLTDNTFLLTERFMNMPIGLSYLLTTGRSLPKYLEADGRGGKQLSVEAIFGDMTEGDAETLRELNDAMKVDFIRSVINAFHTEDNLYDMPHQELVERLRPASRATTGTVKPHN
jgi:hypothetical protein